MPSKIIYFTAGDVATTGEVAEIAVLAGLAQPYTLTVSNGAVAPNLGLDGEGDAILDQCDFVAGTIPDLYSEIGVIDLDSLPLPDLGATRVVLTDQDELVLGDTTYTFTIEDGEITAIDVVIE